MSNGRILGSALPARVCALPECAGTFIPKMRAQRCCSERHGAILCKRERRQDGRETPQPWGDKRRARKHEREARKRGTAVVGEPVTLAYIADRDRWRCHLCGRRVAAAMAWPEPLSPSLDHVVPLSLGGEHSRANVRLAHLRCNIRKNNRSLGEQLSLLG